MKRKAQMEIMGLAIVVVLITMGILFIVQFSLQSRSADLKTEYMESQLSANLLNSLLQLTTDCGEKQVKTLFIDCALGNQVDCGGGEFSCQYLNRTIYEVLNKTLIAWSKPYYFRASNTDNLQPGGIRFGQPCPLGKDTNQYPVQAGVRMVIITLDICRLQ